MVRYWSVVFCFLKMLSEVSGSSAQVAEEKSELEYFEEFFELQNNHPMLQEQREFVSGLIGKLKENEL